MPDKNESDLARRVRELERQVRTQRMALLVALAIPVLIAAAESGSQKFDEVITKKLTITDDSGAPRVQIYANDQMTRINAIAPQHRVGTFDVIIGRDTASMGIGANTSSVGGDVDYHDSPNGPNSEFHVRNASGGGDVGITSGLFRSFTPGTHPCPPQAIALDYLPPTISVTSRYAPSWHQQAAAVHCPRP